MLKRLLGGRSRAATVAYGAWGMLSLMMMGGTLTTLVEAEKTESQAVLARAEAGAAAIEQTVLRVFEAAQTLQVLAQTRLRMTDAGNQAGLLAIDQQLRDAVAPARFGLQSMVIIRRGRVEWTSWPQSRAPYAVGGAAPMIRLEGPLVSAPSFSTAGGRWSASLAWPLLDRNGLQAGSVLLWLDPLALSAMIEGPAGAPGIVSTVQLARSGAFLAHSGDARRFLAERPSRADPGFARAVAQGGGQLHDLGGGVDRLVGLRAPHAIPVVITQAFDTTTALAEFFRLRHIVLTVMLALVSGLFIATRLILANYLLRERACRPSADRPADRAA